MQPLNARSLQDKTWQAGQDRRILNAAKEKGLHMGLGVSKGCANFLEDIKMHLVMQPLNARSQKNQTWQAGQDWRKLDAKKEKGSSIWPLEISTGCASFLEGVKLHLVMQPLNAESQQNKTWQTGQDGRRLYTLGVRNSSESHTNFISCLLANFP
jgi:hypothetical protein